jgi:hypothetical protein
MIKKIKIPTYKPAIHFETFDLKIISSFEFIFFIIPRFKPNPKRAIF